MSQSTRDVVDALSPQASPELVPTESDGPALPRGAGARPGAFSGRDPGVARAVALSVQRSAGNAALCRALATARAPAALVQREDVDGGAGGAGGAGPQDAGTHGAHGAGPVPAPAPTGTEDYDKAIAAKTAFKGGTYSKSSHQPSSGIGLFAADYVPATGTLKITVRCKFKFINGTRSDFPKAPKEELEWGTKSDEWKKKFMGLISSKWSGNDKFFCQKDWWRSSSPASRWRWWRTRRIPISMEIMKIPKGEFRGSSVTSPVFGGTFGGGSAELDSEDIEFADKPGGKQRGAVHEAGHMLGLDDEYKGHGISGFFEGEPDHADLVQSEFGHGVARGADGRIMSGGEDIKPEHGVTFLEVLKEITAMSDWSHEVKPPKAVPAGAAGAKRAGSAP